MEQGGTTLSQQQTASSSDSQSTAPQSDGIIDSGLRLKSANNRARRFGLKHTDPNPPVKVGPVFT